MATTMDMLEIPSGVSPSCGRECADDGTEQFLMTLGIILAISKAILGLMIMHGVGETDAGSICTKCVCYMLTVLIVTVKLMETMLLMAA